jgi:hypothetical protein
MFQAFLPPLSSSEFTSSLKVARKKSNQAILSQCISEFSGLKHLYWHFLAAL